MSGETAIIAFVFTAAVTVGGLIFQVGKLFARVENHEKLIAEFRGEFRSLHSHFDRLMGSHGMAADHDAEFTTGTQD